MNRYRWLWFCLPPLLVMLVHAPALRFGFVNLDDNLYFYENPHVLGGLSSANVAWAFGIHGPSMWVPLTWLSHQAMVSVFGSAPGPQHVLNVLLHAANALLVGLWLWRSTGARWCALAVAAVFAVHPLHVESVAWVTERKDVLSLFFCLLALLCQLRRARAGSRAAFVGMLFFHTLAVMAKPLAVTLPCLMLLWDFWPLQRRLTSAVFVEKLPLLAVSAVGAWLTVLCQQSIGAIASIDGVALPLRLENAVVSYATYLRRLFVPHDLAAVYPYPASVELTAWAGALAVLILVSAAAWQWRRRVPALAVGWLWFLGAMVPMIGIVQAGGAAMADRYAYLPFIGLYLAVAWCAAGAVRRWPAARVPVAVSVAAAVVLLGWLGRGQVAVWRDSESLFRQALANTTGNHLAHNNLGLALDAKGLAAEADAHFHAALACRPGYGEALNNIAIRLARQGRLTEAEPLLADVVARQPDHAAAWHNLGKVLAGLGRHDEARAAFNNAIRRSPGFSVPRYDLACMEISLGRCEEARKVLLDLLAMDPGHGDAWINLGLSEHRLGRPAEAEAAYRRAISIGSALAARNLQLLLLENDRLPDAEQLARTSGDPDTVLPVAGALRNSGDLDGARRLIESLLLRSPDSAEARNELGIVLGQSGDHRGAATCFEEALRLQPGHPAAKLNLDRARRMLEAPQ